MASKPEEEQQTTSEKTDPSNSDECQIICEKCDEVLKKLKTRARKRVKND